MATNYYPNSGNFTGEDFQSKDRDDTTLLERIRNRYDYMVRAWKEVRDEAEKDMRALSTSGPWKDEERNERDANGRPCIHLDQLTQYVSALVNQVKSEPIAIKVDPSGDGADETTAELRSKRIRAIEYESNAMQAYQTAFENAASMGFGFFGITIGFKAWDSMQRVIKVRRLNNPWAILIDPDYKEADASDMQDAFVITREPKKDFSRNHPDATISDFGQDQVKIASAWFDDEMVQVAEYWYLEKKNRRIFWLDMGQQGIQRFFAEDLEGFKVRQGYLIFKDGSFARILEDRRSEQPIVKMCLTNGVEILDTTEWPGKEIPIIPVLGREKFYKSGNNIKRIYESYIRMARDGQMLYDYNKTCAAELVGMTPKTPYIGYKGQFQEDYWETIHKVPRGYAEVEPMTDISGALLPLPQRQPYVPAIEPLEVGAESARRAIQAAVASYGYTRLDDTNVKSGVALRQLDQQRDLGSYHLVDNYKIAIRRAGRIINDLLDDVESGPVSVSLRGLDDSTEVAAINGPGQPRYRLTDEGQHEVSIGTGPSFQTQREEAALFTDSFVSNMQNYGLDPLTARKAVAMLVKLRQLGPIGEQLQKILDPEQGKQQIPPEVQAQMAQMQQQLQAMNAYAQQKEAELADLQKKAEGKELDNETKRQIAALQADVDMFKIKMDTLKAHEQLSSKENIASEQMKQSDQQQKREIAQQDKQMNLQHEEAEVDARIRAVSEDNKVDIAEKTAAMKAQQRQRS